MQSISINLTESEKLEVEYRIFEYRGTKIDVDQYIHSNRLYNEEHFNRIINTNIEKYAALQKCLYALLGSRGHKNISIKDYDYRINENCLTVNI